MVDKLRVGVLGATGLVGQVFVSFLADHPWFELVYLGASPRSAGKKYKEVMKGSPPLPIPEHVLDMEVRRVEEVPKDVEILFSALPSDLALSYELEFVKMGYTVISNASPLRLEKDIPLINPEVNLDHLELIKLQKKERRWKGVIVKNPNCTTAILTLTLKPILDEFGIKRVFVTTMQGISGAGYPGVAALDIVDNIIPYIRNEEYKVENETLKILGRLADDGIHVANIKVSATCTRVPVLHGHLESIHVETIKEVDVEEVIRVFEEFKGPPQELNLPSAPKKPIVVRKEINRPQPRLDRLTERGMSVVVGRVREDHALSRGVKYIALGHNLIRGAAGIAVLIAEALLKLEYI
ncbi:MAG: aspartate-semialdehyde dehydrogenase [Thermoprotei archaeon]|nr:MAG: aspartate-semialdehyde dehydrogenase [Thermoprotei archaeon]RLF20324.1 MAG: aspartate-semialdehyde dehydrogenase [Thermoprotei archaeon]